MVGQGTRTDKQLSSIRRKLPRVWQLHSATVGYGISSADRSTRWQPERRHDMRTLQELFPTGRFVCYEGDNPEAFAREIRAQFGFDPSGDAAWETHGYPGFSDPFGRRNWFHCPAEYLDGIYGGNRWPMGS